MTFASDVHRFAIKVRDRSQAVVLGVAAAAHASVVEGSAATGAPGQPVDTGFLHASWQNVPDRDGWGATIGTNVAYARPIEDGVGQYGPLTLRSKVGGFHSLKLTVAGADALVREVMGRLRV